MMFSTPLNLPIIKDIFNSISSAAVSLKKVFYQGHQYQTIDNSLPSEVNPLTSTLFDGTINPSSEELGEDKSRKQIFLFKTNQIDFLEKLPQEISYEILKFLNIQELERCCQISKKWKVLIDNDSIWQKIYLNQAFTWSDYGHLGKFPPIKRGIYKSFCKSSSSCQDNKNNMIILIPEKIDGKPLTLRNFVTLIQSKVNKPDMFFIEKRVMDAYGDISIKHSHWIVMSDDIMKDSRSKTLKEIEKLTIQLTEQAGISYIIPNLLETVICKFVKTYHFKKGLSYDDVEDRLICQQKINNDPVVVRGNVKDGIEVAVDGELIVHVQHYAGIQAMIEF